MKKFAITFALIAVVLVSVPQYFLGFSIWHLGSAVNVATGLGAKLACSARFISGFDEQQSLQDVVSYSPAAALLDLTFDYENNTVQAELFGMAKTIAKYRKGLGCTLEIGDTHALDQVALPIASDKINPQEETWVDIDEQLQEKVSSILKQDNRNGYQTRALLVVKDQRVVAETYAEGIDARTPLMGWSMGKSLTAMLIGRYAYLNPSEPKSVSFKAWQNDGREKIELEHLLQMTSGLDFDETYAPGSDATHMLFTAGSASNVALNSQLIHEPSTHFSYSSGTTNILARWLYGRTGNSAQSLVDFAYTQLFQPLGMEHTIFEPDASGVFVGSSYIYASARNWARLGLLMANGGIYQGQRLLAEDWVIRAASPNNSQNEKAYGYQFWLNHGDDELRWPSLPKDTYAMLGNRKQHVMVIPSENMVIVRLGWTKSYYPTEVNTKQILDVVSEHSD
ncbi:serine hydrolase [Bermanella marisrubri]|uniref:Beta-lactamase-related domain-containing protein n=1 Tax=Bermanella marisrubri TaxID=207949 RepID=Q1N3B2_9GAMM|nr:serine hydrolase [Bermanella marisrubri]EAT12679.1 hypothetical protein RED65_13382 [Oceanobacter sp. RED65] [Bermanella marisrubri]QIZ85198.1 serine hydrolase [Bermanella marisrubri]